MHTLVKSSKTEDLKALADILNAGGIVAFPTDTVYGLGAVFDDEIAVDKIFAAKGRNENKPLSILVSDIGQVEMLANIGEGEKRRKALSLMKAFWPGALTLIFEKKPGIPDNVTAKGDTIGVRMPDLEVTRELIGLVGKPLAAPSANTSGKRSGVTLEDVLEDLDGKIDAVVDGGRCDIGLASTVVDMTKDEPVILRQGVITREMITDAMN